MMPSFDLPHSIVEPTMKKLLLISLLCVNSLAFAHCSNPVACELKYVDQAFTKTTLTGAELEKARAMRDEGEKMMKDGNEDDAMKLLKKTKKFLLEGKLES
jgi:hypothetical protein